MDITLQGITLTGASVQPWNPSQLFANGEKGVWYDPSDLSTLFQDSAKTIPVTADGDPIGCIVDKSGNGFDATQTVSGSRPIYRTNGLLSWIEGNGSAFMVHNADYPGTNNFLYSMAFEGSGTASMYPFISWGWGGQSIYPGLSFLHRGNASPLYAPQSNANDGTNSSIRGGVNSFSQGKYVDIWTREAIMYRNNVGYNVGAMNSAINITSGIKRLFARYTFTTQDILNGKFYGGVYVVKTPTTQDILNVQYYLDKKAGF